MVPVWWVTWLPAVTGDAAWVGAGAGSTEIATRTASAIPEHANRRNAGTAASLDLPRGVRGAPMWRPDANNDTVPRLGAVSLVSRDSVLVRPFRAFDIQPGRGILSNSVSAAFSLSPNLRQGVVLHAVC